MTRRADNIFGIRDKDTWESRASSLLYSACRSRSPTSPHDDAVTFSYGAVANSDRDFHPVSITPSRAYSKPLRGSFSATQ